MNKNFTFFITLFFIAVIAFQSCSKSDSLPASNDPCVGKNIVISAVVTASSSPTSNNGIITVAVTGSSGFSYSLNSGAYQSSNIFNNLAAGSYTIAVKDAAGCIKSKSFAVTASACPSITVTGTVTPSTTTTTADGSITATASGSTGFTFSINSGTFQPGGSFNSLAAGSYTITAKDANGCTGSAVFVVISAACPTITVNTVVTPAAGPTATNGALNCTATGGTAPYVYSINGGTSFQSSGNFINLAGGNYTIVAKDANNCLGTSGSVAVTVNPCPVISINTLTTPSDKCSNNTGMITVTAAGSAGFTYNINGAVFQSSNVFNNLATGTFAISVKDLNGCTTTNNTTVPIAPPGTKFSEVKSMMQANCALSGCHSGATPQNGLNFADDCTIVNNSARIRARAVDGNPGFMPPTGQLPAADKQKILDWVNAGGQHSNN